MKFVCVNDFVPEETTVLLRSACLHRGVLYEEIHATSFDFDPQRQMQAGDMLYTPAVAIAAMRVQQFLYSPGVATFHSDEEGIFFDCMTSPLLFQRHGLPIPRTIYCATTDRDLLRGYAEQLGGLPIVVKLLGGSSGVGVMRVDSLASLFSVVDFAMDVGRSPLLCAHIPDAVHWRCVVVGDEVIAAYRNHVDQDDFRTHATQDAADYTATVSPAMARLAIRAVKALRIEAGGVDILEHATGRLYLLEANFPFYYAQAQLAVGIDIAGRMVEHLMAKALRLNPERLGVVGAEEGLVPSLLVID